MSEKLGLLGAVSIALGGMIGGGIFAVLGVVAEMSGAAAWIAFFGGGIVAFCAGYSYIRLQRVGDVSGGSVSFLEEFIDSTTITGMVGWTLLFGYIGSMGMYAFAFGSFATRLLGVEAAFGVPLRPIVSIVAILGFVGLNVVGARASGLTEVLLVGAKVGILLVFGVWGFYFGARTGQLTTGLSSSVEAGGLLMSAALSFVAFQGWQLLFYDEESLRDARTTIPRAIYLSIPLSLGLYILVAVVTTGLLQPETIAANPEVSLAIAAEPFMGRIGFALISVAALFSTGSAINATLFSAARFATGMLEDDLLPDQIGDADADGAPTRPLLVLGLITATFTAYGSLQGITSFASLAFITVFGSMSLLAFRNREGLRTGVLPAVGVLGAVLFFPSLVYHLAVMEPAVFGVVLVVTVVLIGLEVLYFERETIRSGIDGVRR
ncbi:APC family permease [Halorubrum salsamenti]|jgi:amino acid transporter|uniref:APC family permease n=1 Tax=Halorubrum salsamenti TaxID=2583990 RepID=UPI00119E0D20|nr:APC family permease [Halorubrum salsamenti]